MRLKQIKFGIHFVFWFIMCTITINYLLRDTHFFEALFEAIVYNFLVSIPFYINYFIFAKYLLVEKKYSKYIFSMITQICMLTYLSLSPYLEIIIADEDTYSQAIDIAGNIILVLFISTLIRGIEIWLEKQQQESRLEKEKLQAELNFLRLQINPHFLFNTLNNIYSLAYIGDKNSAKMIAKLSKILRYMLNDCKENRVSLIKEIELLHTYIDLQLLRFGDPRNIDLYSEGINHDHKIAPSILITLLENCFKHGDVNSSKNGWIQISATVENNLLVFSTENSFDNVQTTKEINKGIGLVNIQKQLDLYYPSGYDLNLSTQDNIFKIMLKIKLENNYEI